LSGDIRTTWSINKIALVATGHYLVRVMGAMLKRGTTWEESVVAADEPKGVTPAVAVLDKCSDKTVVLCAGSNWFLTLSRRFSS
jgi:hypothetical protein